MPTYIILASWTQEGIKNIKEAPERIKKGVEGYKALGGKVIGFYAVMGEYDYVGISEAPNDEVAMALMLGLGSLGNVRTTTLKAFPVAEFTEIVKKIP